jgi:hypothetical protein
MQAGTFHDDSRDRDPVCILALQRRHELFSLRALKLGHAPMERWLWFVDDLQLGLQPVFEL